MFPGPTELRLIGCLIELTWTQKIKIKYFDTKNQLADILTKGNFTRDEWNHLLCLFNISLSVLQCALIHWRNDLNTIRVKNESKQNRDQ